MSELIEKVGDAIYDAIERTALDSNCLVLHGGRLFFEGDCDFGEVRAAAITAVFDWLAEPSGEAKHDGRYAIGGEPGSRADTEEAAADCWTAMLAEMRKQALG